MKCVLCNQAKATTRDHIPPQGIFPKPRPSNLITIPSCQSCNNSTACDDEYFRNMLAIANSFNDDKANKMQSTAVRSMHRNNKLKNDLLAKTKLYPNGNINVLYDHPSFNNIIIKITKGLFFHEQQNILPLNARITPHWYEKDGFTKIKNKMHITDQHFRNVGDSQFLYFCYAETKESVWLYNFYDTLFAGAKTKY